MGGFLTGTFAAVLLAVVAYWAYTTFDVPSGSPGSDISVILGQPADMSPEFVD